jgi:BASS family bile acid:Na+ symporter
MSRTERAFAMVYHILHRRVLFLVVLSYAIAGAAPSLGLWVKDARLIDVSLGFTRARATIPALLLAFLLFSAGLRVPGERLRAMLKSPELILSGLAANLAVPILYVMALCWLLGRWHNPEEMSTIVIGMALVASMPVAGSSTSWAQEAGGDMALSLGMVLASTLLSPLSTPAVLRLLGGLTPSSAATELRSVADGGTGTFLMACVLVPSLLGIACRQIYPRRLLERLDQPLRTLSTLTLLILCYANASACLPHVFRSPDWDFLGMVLVAVLGMCVVTFSGGYALGRLLRADQPQRAALMYGMGMNNNGTGLVLASIALGTRPIVLVPIIVYNLGQHLVAGFAVRFSRP